MASPLGLPRRRPKSCAGAGVAAETETEPDVVIGIMDHATALRWIARHVGIPTFYLTMSLPHGGFTFVCLRRVVEELRYRPQERFLMCIVRNQACIPAQNHVKIRFNLAPSKVITTNLDDPLLGGAPTRRRLWQSCRATSRFI